MHIFAILDVGHFEKWMLYLPSETSKRESNLRNGFLIHQNLRFVVLHKILGHLLQEQHFYDWLWRPFWKISALRLNISSKLKIDIRNGFLMPKNPIFDVSHIMFRHLLALEENVIIQMAAILDFTILRFCAQIFFDSIFFYDLKGHILHCTWFQYSAQV